MLTALAIGAPQRRTVRIQLPISGLGAVRGNAGTESWQDHVVELKSLRGVKGAQRDRL